MHPPFFVAGRPVSQPSPVPSDARPTQRRNAPEALRIAPDVHPAPVRLPAATPPKPVTPGRGIAASLARLFQRAPLKAPAR